MGGSASPIAVLLVSGDAVLRAAWSRSLSQLPERTGQEIVEAPSVKDAGGVGGPDDPALILLDVGDAAAPEIAAIVAGLDGATRLVVVGTADPGSVRSVLGAGARGYLFPTDHRPDEPGSALPAADRPPTLAWMRVCTAAGAVTELSAREIQVLQGVADGRTNGDIAADLRLSPLTVKSHLARIGRKLGTGDRAHAVLLALRAGVIS